MPYRRQLVCILFLFGVVATLHFGYADAPAPIHSLTLQASQESYQVGPYLEILEDENGEWTIEDVTEDLLLNKFAPAKSKTLNLGLSESAFWFRFSVRSKLETNLDNRWFLKIDRCGLTDCKLFIPKHPTDTFKNPTLWQVLDLNDTPINDSRKGIVCQPAVFPLPLLTAKQTTFYLRIHNPDGGLYLPLWISTEEAVRDSLKRKTLWLGVYYGIVLALLVFNLYLYISLRESVQLYYTFYIGSVIFYFLFINGIFLNYFTDVILHDRLNILALGLTIFWGTYFARSFLNTKAHAKIMDKLLAAVIIAAAGILMVTPFVSIMFLNQATSLLGMMSPLLMMVAGIICWRRGFKPIFFFLVAWAILCLGGLVYALTYRGTLPYSVPTFYSFQIGSCLEVVILSFALGERIRRLRHERDSIRMTFGKYVSDKVCDEILSGRIPLDGESKEVTVLISDLRGYTPLVESTPPKQLVKITNTYLEAMANTIEKHKGLILQYVGDSIQAVFGAPLPVENHPELALKAALDMRKQLDRVNEKLKSEGFEGLRHGIGIHSGKVTAANIGSPDRLSYSLSGLTVNLASRIQNLNKKFGTDILVSATTMSQIGNELEVEKLGPTEIKGLKEPLEIYRVI
ncbi:MAG: 7TM diverse intracellular signaling domain-containing protein [Desulfobacterales bacterium]|jgi:adenylate cyclase